MMNSMTKLILVLLFIASSLSLMARADDDSKEVRRLVMEKEIMPLERLLPSIRRHGDWKLLEIELAKRSSVGCNTKSARKRQNSS